MRERFMMGDCTSLRWWVEEFFVFGEVRFAPIAPRLKDLGTDPPYHAYLCGYVQPHVITTSLALQVVSLVK